jgi:hypothetical protein
MQQRDTRQQILDDILYIAHNECGKHNYVESCPKDQALEIASRMYLINFENVKQDVCDAVLDEIDYIATLIAGINVINDDSQDLRDRLCQVQHTVQEAIYKAYKSMIDEYYYEGMITYHNEVKPIFETMQTRDYLQRGD